MRIYRVENVRGEGPYCANANLSKMWDEHNNSKSHPCPLADSMSPVAPWEIFGFDSIEKLQDWFHGFEEDLNVAGFAVNVYEVEEWRLNRGRKQVAFNRKMSSYVGAYSIRECHGQVE